MPEYLAPAVYVEEVDTGSKPIEGVSTSTAGMVGVTERGPGNVPMLVTSTGEYRRLFGEGLNRDDYGEHRFLPNSIEGFFTNGGKRVYVTRALAADRAEAAWAFVFDSRGTGAPPTRLLRPITSATPTTAYLLDATGMSVTSPPSWLQLGSGGDVEYAKLQAWAGAENHVVLDRPLAFAHADGDPVVQITAGTDSPCTLSAALPAGARSVTVAPSVGSIVGGSFVQLGTAATAEVVRVSVVAGTTLTLATPVAFDHASGEAVVRLTGGPTAPTTLDAGYAASAGDTVIHLANPAAYGAATTLVKIGAPGNEEVRRISGLVSVPLESKLARAFAVGTMVESVTETPAVGAPPKLDALAPAGATALRLSDRRNIVAGSWLRIGQLVDTVMEYVQVSAVPNPGSPAVPDPGIVVLAAPLANEQAAAKDVVRITGFNRDAAGVRGLASAAGQGAKALSLSGPTAGIVAGHLLRLLPPGGAAAVVRASGAPTALTPRRVTLAPPARKLHAAGAAVTPTRPLFKVQALDAGGWGQRLRVAVREPVRAAVDSRVRSPAATGVPDPTHLRLESANGIELGSVLQEWDAATDQWLGAACKVIAVDRGNGFLLTTDVPHGFAMGDQVRSREFDLEVYLMRQPDKANPGRDGAVVGSEVFAGLTLDPRHSRYLHKVVGCTWDYQNPSAVNDDDGQPLRRSDRRGEGASEYLRVRDVALDEPSPAAVQTAREDTLRPGPVFDLEVLPDGRRRPTRFALEGGTDMLPAPGDESIYLGQDNVDPERRTGLHTLRNIEDISIVAAPGRTSVSMQNALINHCELMRYRFAVLDGNPPPKDAMADIQAQRGQYDTKYAALYHPWLLIPDPYPASAGSVPDYPVPPSGHMVGIYARTDIERGVHKAPANEVVRGITGLQRVLNKEQHDILNPYPVNINVIRDFRNNNRGIRVYGGRCITSDSDWKYVNVRRLMIYVEASIDRGLQWVVFEPNAEPLWARVRRSITNFLTTTWRNGALEGTKPEEAFFVKCDRTTMTQTDIDQGRLICLVGVAPVKPAEFVIVRIGLWTAHADE